MQSRRSWELDKEMERTRKMDAGSGQKWQKLVMLTVTEGPICRSGGGRRGYKADRIIIQNCQISNRSHLHVLKPMLF